MFERFIHELPVETFHRDIRELFIRFNMGEFLFNAVLNEGLKRLNLIKQSQKWTKAKKLTKSLERTKLFREVFREYKLTDYDLQKYAIETKNKCAIGHHLDTHSTQKIATRAYESVKDYNIGKKGKPRFKAKGKLRSIEGKDNKAGIRFRNNTVYWKGLTMKVILDLKDKHKLQEYAISSKNKFCRLIRKEIKGQTRFFVQLVQEGSSFIKHPSKEAEVGLDIGPSTIAAVSKEKAMLNSFCSELEKFRNEVTLLQRKMDRSLRSMNKDNYTKQQTVKNKKLKWKKSNNYKKMQSELSENYRKLKEHRKRLHGKLANKIISFFGNVIKTEKISYKKWQKRYGKSINFRAPSKFLNILRRKAENAGGHLEEFSTKATFLSQICLCGAKQKKPLSQRWHTCSCNIKPTQRDLFSAFLALHVNNNYLDISQAKNTWPGAHPLLEQAILRLNQTAIGKSRLASFGLNQSLSGLLAKDKSAIDEAKNAVGIKSESLREFINFVVRTP